MFGNKTLLALALGGCLFADTAPAAPVQFGVDTAPAVSALAPSVAVFKVMYRRGNSRWYERGGLNFYDATRLADERHRLRSAAPDLLDHVARVARGHPDLAQLCGKGLPAGHRLEAAVVAAAAENVVVAGDADVADVARGAKRQLSTMSARSNRAMFLGGFILPTQSLFGSNCQFRAQLWKSCAWIVQKLCRS